MGGSILFASKPIKTLAAGLQTKCLYLYTHYVYAYTYRLFVNRIVVDFGLKNRGSPTPDDSRRISSAILKTDKFQTERAIESLA